MRVPKANNNAFYGIKELAKVSFEINKAGYTAELSRAIGQEQ